MLEIVKFNEDEYDFPCLIVLGCFDGIHAGHTELLKKAKLQAKINGLDLGVMLFSDGKGDKQIYTFDERLRLLEQFNTKFVLKVDFTEDFKKIKPLEFLSILEEKLNVKAYMSGKDFKFGAGKKGKSSTLKSYAEDEENGVWYLSVKEVTDGDAKISTTLIKEMLENGDLANANRLLGRSFCVSGVAEQADGAVKIAYPANKVALKDGAYAVKCTVGETECECTAEVGAGGIVLGLADFDKFGEELTVEFLECVGTAVAEGVAELAVADGEQPAVEEISEQSAVEEAQPVENEEQPAVVEEQPAVEPSDDGFNDMVTDDFEVEAEHPEEVVEEQPEEVTEEVVEEQPEEEYKPEESIPTVSGEIAEIGEQPEEEQPEEKPEDTEE